MNTKAASFRLDDYRFSKIYLDLGSLPDDFYSTPLDIELKPRGVYYPSKQTYKLQFNCKLMHSEQTPLVEVICDAYFIFNETLALEDIPDYFYPNSIAIVFPYLRAMISTLTLQANIIHPVILPTRNLSSLKEDLKSQTTIE